MRFYLAAKYTSKERIREMRKLVEAKGHTVTSQWLDHDLPETVNDTIRFEQANNDLANIWKADCFILDTLDESNTGGREVEWGCAITLGLKVILVGPTRNVFHLLADEHFESWEECLVTL